MRVVSKRVYPDSTFLPYVSNTTRYYNCRNIRNVSTMDFASPPYHIHFTSAPPQHQTPSETATSLPFPTPSPSTHSPP